MALYVKKAGREQELKWAWIWFKQLSEFHGAEGKGIEEKGTHQKGEHGESYSGNSKWEFSTDQVIRFLRSKRDANVPTWKRMKIIEGLITFRIEVQGRSAEDLVPLQTKMVEIIAIERAKNGGFDSIEDVVGVINPNEPDAIQAFRRALRKDGKALATERSYVGKLRKFMAERAITCLADFESIGADVVEAHLTDLAVDGNVAPKTQSAAFHALLKFFKLVLKRDMGRIEAMRATKGEMVPTVLSPEEVIRVFAGLNGVHWVVAKLLYGRGKRIRVASLQ